jgi:nucleoside-diphosphate-sugar epimerase
VLPLLQREKHEVTALAHTRAQAKRFVAAGIDCAVWDLAMPRPLDVELHGYQAVVHLAGTTPGTDDSRLCERLDLGGTKRLLETLSREHLRRFVYASSMAVYGDQHGDCVNESVQPQPRTAHARAKLFAEHMLLDAHRVWGLPVTILRLAHLYGPGSCLERFVERLCRREMWLPSQSNQVTWGFVSVHDAARAVIEALHVARAGEVYLVADDHPMALHEALEITAGHLGHSRLPSSGGLLQRFRRRGEPPMALSESASPANEKLKRELRFTFEHPSLAAGLQAMKAGKGVRARG